MEKCYSIFITPRVKQDGTPSHQVVCKTLGIKSEIQDEQTVYSVGWESQEDLKNIHEISDQKLQQILDIINNG